MLFYRFWYPSAGQSWVWFRYHMMSFTTFKNLLHLNNSHIFWRSLFNIVHIPVFIFVPVTDIFVSSTISREKQSFDTVDRSFIQDKNSKGSRIDPSGVLHFIVSLLDLAPLQVYAEISLTNNLWTSPRLQLECLIFQISRAMYYGQLCRMHLKNPRTLQLHNLPPLFIASDILLTKVSTAIYRWLSARLQ